MKTFKTGLIALTVIMGTHEATAADDPLMQQAQKLFRPIPEAPPAVKGVPATPAMIALGKALYFEPRLSQSHNISCNTCHQVGLGGVDMLPTSIGHNWQRGGRNAPTVLNAVFNTAQFWDGRAADLKEQAVGPIQNPIEMGITGVHAVEMLRGIPGYQPMFAAAFPGEKDKISIANVGKAIAVFEATLITPNAPFDKYLRGDDGALSADQKAGLKLFIEKGCAGCHNGINIGGGVLRAIWRGGKARCGHPAARGQGTIPGDQDGERRVRLQGADPAQHRADTALFSFGQGLGSQAGGRGDGNESTGTAPERSGDRQCCRIPPRVDRRAAAGDLSHSAAEHQRYAAA